MNDKEKKEMIKQLEQEFHNALDVLRLHKNYAWKSIEEDENWKPEDGEFIFEDKYIVSWERISNSLLDDRKYTSVEVELQDDVKMKLQLKNMHNDPEYPLYVVEFDIRSNKSIDGQTSAYSYDHTVDIDYDKFKLLPRQITKVRKQINKVVNLDELLLSKMRMYKDSLAYRERKLKEIPDEIEKLKKGIQKTEETYAKYFGQSEVA